MFKKLFIMLADWGQTGIDLAVKISRTTIGLTVLVAGFLGMIVKSISWVISIISSGLLQIFGYIDSLSNPGIPSGDIGIATQYLSIANTFFPVQEMLACLVILLVLESIGAVYGFIKSWIPTVSS